MVVPLSLHYMDTLPFVIWMIGWPLAWELGELSNTYRGKSYTQSEQEFSKGFALITWISVAILLWFNR